MTDNLRTNHCPGCKERQDRIEALEVEVALLHDTAKANNQLAKMYKTQADEYRAKYVAALEPKQ